MSSPDYNDPAEEEKWCDDRRAEVVAYLRNENVEHGRIAEWPAWHVAPYVSIWAVESAHRPESIGWWVICGDVPSHYVSAKDVETPRKAMHVFAEKWLEVAAYMERGEHHPTTRIGPPQSWPELAPLLKSRAQLLSRWVEDDTIWEDDEPPVQ